MGLLSPGQQPVASSCPGLCVPVAQGYPESEGNGAHRVLGGGQAGMARVLPGFLWPLSLPCLVSLGGVYLGASGEKVGQRQRV